MDIYFIPLRKIMIILYLHLVYLFKDCEKKGKNKRITLEIIEFEKNSKPRIVYAEKTQIELFYVRIQYKINFIREDTSLIRKKIR